MGDYYGPSSTERRDEGRGYPDTKRRRRDEIPIRGRHGDDHYRDEERYGRRIQDDRECLECSTMNYRGDYECSHCRTVPSADATKLSKSSSGNKSFTQELDEFGRAASRLVKKPKQIWPPHFETNGSAFDFDIRSGMFYESKSDFFYDPKSKLYYGNKDSVYYSYNSGKKCFQQFEKIDQVNNSDAPVPILDAVQPQGISNGSKKNSISINLKTKSLGSLKGSKKSKKYAADKTKATAEISSAGTTSLATKKRAADIDKWTERQVEKRQNEVLVDAKVAMTAKGEPICSLCRRKFPTLEKLAYHERVSKLHRENMIKIAAKQPAVTNDGSSSAGSSEALQVPSYIDRAQHRRILNGPDTSTPAPPQSVASLGSSAEAETVKPEESLGKSNIGNKMLLKLGWKEGQGLGRQGDEPRRNSQQDSIQEDWQRIESMAATGGAKDRRGRGIGSGR